MSEAIRWWLILLVVGAATLPLCLATFRRLPDRGYTLSKPFSLLFLGFTFWFLNSIHILPNHRGGIIAALLLLMVIAGFIAWRDRDDLRDWFERNWRYVLGVEVAFLIIFAVAVWLRSFVGTVEYTEQPMDLMFLNAMDRAKFFPPEDPWLSGHTVAYYYFGYLIVAMVGKFAGVPPDIGYNIGFAMIAALTIIAGFGIVYNLVRLREDVMPREAAAPAPRRARAPRPTSRRAVAATSERGALAPDAVARSVVIPAEARPYIFGALGAFMIGIMGTLTWVLKFASAYGIGGQGFYDWVNVQGITADEPRNGWYPSDFFGFFDGTRIYPLNKLDSPNESYVITEWPMFSFVLGDLHPHVMALPFVLLVAGLALTLYCSEEPLDIAFWLKRPLLALGAAIMVGALGFINTWDIATMSFVVVLAALVSNFARLRRLNAELFIQTVSFAVPLLLGAVLLYLPFYLSFSSQASGLFPVVTNEAITVPGTSPLHAFLYWGPLFLITVPFVAVRLFAMRDRIIRRDLYVAAAVPLIIVVGWVLVFAYHNVTDSPELAGANGFADQILDRGIGWITAIAFGAILSASLLALWLEITADDERAERHAAIFALLLASTAFLLIIGTEFFYVGDLFNSRMNTVFKLSYQAWLLLAIAGGFALYYLFSTWQFTFPSEQRVRAAWGGAAALMLFCGLAYPLGATFNRTENFEKDGQLHSLHHFSVDEQAAFAQIRKLAERQEIVIAEAVGGDYWTSGPVSRVSAATGAPAVIGWVGHEHQWRGEDSTADDGRFEDIDRLYRTSSLDEVRGIVDKYGITYIYVGDFERTTYGGEALAKFSEFSVAYQAPGGTVTLYRAEGVEDQEASATP
jgi:YYY domain-containing protein